MKSRPNRHKIALLSAVIAALALPAPALAEYYVPPGNSAATQYTEAFPTAGGESGGKRGHRGKVIAAETLGAGNAKRLESRGPSGAAAATTAAETAPPSLVEAAEGDGTRRTAGEGRADTGASDRRGGSTAQGQGSPGSNPSGSPGLGEVVAQATGSSGDGSLGLLLPLAIVATLAGAIAYGLRHRPNPTA